MKNRKTSLSAALAVAFVMSAGNAAAQSVNPANGAVTMGTNATAGNHAVAISTNANASGQQAIAIGTDATATGESAVATGTWASADGIRASAYGPAAKADGKDSVAVGFNANAAGDRGVAVGQSTYAAVGSSAFGDGAEAIGADSTAIGGGADAKGDLSTAVGLISQAIGRGSVAMGNNAQAQTNGSVSIGTASWVSGLAGTTVGFSSAATAYGASAYGTSSKATGYYSSAVGAYSTASHDNSVALGYGSTTTASNQVAVGNRTISQVRAGLVSATSTEAINGSQLYQTNQRVTKVEGKQDAAGVSTASSFGGNSTYNAETGEVSTSLAYKNTQHDSVQGALDAIADDSNGKVEYERNADGSIDYTRVSLGGPRVGNGTQGNPLTTISNVNAGTLDTDAVNVWQLNQMRNGLQVQIDDQWEAIRDLNGRVNGLDKRMGQMGAMSAALAMMNGAGEAGLPVGQIAYSGAWGQYGSHSAFAIGAKVRTSERASLSLGVSYNGGKAMGGIGFSYIGR